MDIRHIEHFLQLAKSEHVSETADLFNISQPSLSKSIASLEAEVGTRLFDRTGNRIKLNQNGKKYLEYAEKAIDLLKTASLAANNIDNSIRGDISFSCHAYPGIIVPCATSYARTNPYVSFSNVGNAGASEPDFTFFSALNDSDIMRDAAWITTPLFKEHYLLAASPRYKGISETGGEISLGQLKNELFVAFSSENILIKDATHLLCQHAGFFPRIFYKTNDFFIKMCIVDEGCAIAIIPECCLDDAVKLSGDVRCYRMPDADFQRTVYVRRKKDMFMSEVAMDFWYFMQDYFGVCEQ